MANFESITVDAAKKIIDADMPTIVDIRDRSAFEAGHLQNAQHVDDRSIGDFLNSADKEKPLICYCYHGISSQSAADYFSQQGFAKVYSIKGGFEAWRMTYPTVSV